MGKNIWSKEHNVKIAVLVILVVSVSLLHFLIPTESHSFHKAHIILRKLYYLPPVIAAAWFGLRGTLYVTITISILFTAHAILDWPGNYMEQANQLGELASFWVVGLIPGYLFDRQRSLLVSLAKANEETLLALVSSLDMREKNTRLHSQRVRDYTQLLANKYGVPEADRRVIGLGALLHDVGKIAVPDHILLKPGTLSDDEWMEMRKHPLEGYKLLQKIDFLRDAAEIVYAHHEWYDGTGYPRGLARENIPLGARLFMVADVFDALISARPYHEALSYNEALEIMRKDKGTHFDPSVLELFQKVDPAEWESIQRKFSNSCEK